MTFRAHPQGLATSASRSTPRPTGLRSCAYGTSCSRRRTTSRSRLPTSTAPTTRPSPEPAWRADGRVLQSRDRNAPPRPRPSAVRRVPWVGRWPTGWSRAPTRAETARWTIPPGYRNYFSSEHIGELTDDYIEAIYEHAQGLPEGPGWTFIVPWGGAVARPSRPGPLANRDAAWVIHPGAFWDNTARDAGSGSLGSRVPEQTGLFHHGVWLNFIGDEGQDRIKAAFGEEELRGSRQSRGVMTPTTCSAPTTTCPAPKPSNHVPRKNTPGIALAAGCATSLTSRWRDGHEHHRLVVLKRSVVGRYVMRRPDNRTHHHAAFWALFVAAALRYPWTWLLDGGAATSIWIPPRRHRDGPGPKEEQLEQLAREHLGESTEDYLELLNRFESAHPARRTVLLLSLAARHAP